MIFWKNGGAFGVEKQTVWGIFRFDGNVFMLFRMSLSKLEVGQLEGKQRFISNFSGG